GPNQHPTLCERDARCARGDPADDRREKRSSQTTPPGRGQTCSRTSQTRATQTDRRTTTAFGCLDEKGRAGPRKDPCRIGRGYGRHHGPKCGGESEQAE